VYASRSESLTAAGHLRFENLTAAPGCVVWDWASPVVAKPYDGRRMRPQWACGREHTEAAVSASGAVEGPRSSKQAVDLNHHASPRHEEALLDTAPPWSE